MYIFETAPRTASPVVPEPQQSVAAPEIQVGPTRPYQRRQMQAPHIAGADPALSDMSPYQLAPPEALRTNRVFLRMQMRVNAAAGTEPGESPEIMQPQPTPPTLPAQAMEDLARELGTLGVGNITLVGD